MEKMECRNCPYWHDMGAENGECRRYGPGKSQMGWVWVTADKWCGEHPKIALEVFIERQEAINNLMQKKLS